MDQSDDPRELERKIEQASRIASRVTDQTTVERLRAWIEDLKQKLRQRREARRNQHTRPGNLGTERTPSRPRLGVLASGRVRDQRARPAVIDCLSIGRSAVCLKVSMCRSSCHSSTSQPSTSCLASLIASATSAHRRSTRFWTWSSGPMMKAR